MFLKALSLLNFKNYPEFEATFSARINCFTGNNGVGKTNLLDAIHYLSFCKSYFNPVDTQNIRHGEGYFAITGTFSDEDGETEIYCALKRGQKKVFRKNKKEYERLSEHIGQYPLVMISPNDSELIGGASELRRKFLDGIIAQYDKTYLERLISYNQVLRHRNALLRQFSESHVFDAETLDIYDVQLSLHGNLIINTRESFIKKFVPLFNDYYNFVSESHEEAGLTYENSVDNGELHAALMSSLARDRVSLYTSAGPHRDDLHFTLNGHSLRKFASQGQQKSFLLALKLAQYEFIRDQKKLKPLLLLDDVYDKLDESRFSKLIELVSSEKFGQVFITDTHTARIREVLDAVGTQHRIFAIDIAGKAPVNEN